ncbi:MAG: DUF1501 domain-containing protein [Planctomycetota bacterium]
MGRAAPGSCAVLDSQPSDDERDTFVMVFVRGGLDSFSLLVPHGDDAYFLARPRTSVPRSMVHDIDGYFGLNHAASPLLPLYREGRLAFATAIGHVVDTRSHFQSMRHVEEAFTGPGSIGTGWIARHLNATPQMGSGPGRAIALNATLPTSLQGGPATIPVPSLADFGFRGPAEGRAARVAALRRMYSIAPEPDRGAGLAALGLAYELSTIDFAGRVPEGGAEYPAGKLGRGLYEAASLIKARSGVEVIEADSGDWDDHRSTGPRDGAFAARSHQLGSALAAFMTDLGDDAERVTVLVLSEFGRVLAENGSGGTDHGRGGLGMILGGSHVVGGKLYGKWPGIGKDELDSGALRVTLDARDVLAEILHKRLRTQDIGAVLPGHSPAMLGMLRE